MSTDASLPVEDMLDSWRVNNAICLELLDLCPDETLDLKPRKGKTVRSHFVHIIGCRRAWLERRSSRRSDTIPKLDFKTASREEIRDGLVRSSEQMAEYLRELAEENKARRSPPLMFFAYAVAHDAHHRAQIELTLRIHDMEPDDTALYGLWEWTKKK
ncbi:MAG: DinB family protein [Fimbriimonadia bacterium]|jgi:uncharacterized damage-inducible protein DinB